MKVQRFVWASLVLIPLLCVEEAESELGLGMVLVTLIGGYLLGQLAFSTFVIFLLAVVPPDEGRSLSINQTPGYRIARSIFNFPQDDGLKLLDYASVSSANVPNQNSLRRIKRADNEEKRDGRFLTGLLKSDPANCMPQVMCELIDAKEPSSKTDTMNDYKYLVKEFLKSDDDDNDKDDDGEDDFGLFRTDSRRVKQNKKNNSKKKPIKNKDDSSPEDSGSKQSEEEKQVTSGMAEFMDLQEEDALEDQALADLVDDDPGTISFAMADMKRKENLKRRVAEGEFGPVDSTEYLQYGYLNNINFKRNLDLLNNTLKNNDKNTVFRTSRAVEDSFLKRKKRELEQTKDVMDRTRIAAEVGAVTRSARKCRALFDTCGTSDVNGIVNNIRRVLHGNPRRKSTAISKTDIKNLVREIKTATASQQPSDIKVIVNLGGNPNNDGSQQLPYITANGKVPSSIIYNPAPTDVLSTTTQKTVSTTKPKLPDLSSIEKIEFFLTNATKKSPSKNETKTQTAVTKKNKNSTENKNRNSTEIVNGSNKVLPTLSTRNTPSSKTSTAQTLKQKQEYKKRLEEASKLLSKVPKSIAKNTKKLQKPVSNVNQVQERIHQLIKVIEPKIKKKKDSSEESMESSEEFPMLLNDEMSHLSSLSIEEPTMDPLLSLFPTIQPFDYPIQSRRYDPPANYQQHSQNVNSNPSWMSNVFDLFFKDKQTAPLPRTADRWIPSAQRHAHPSPMPMYPVNNFGYPPPYYSSEYLQEYQQNLGPYFDQLYRPQHQFNSVKERQPKGRNKHNRNIKPKKSSPKKTSKKTSSQQNQRPVKYKSRNLSNRG